MKVTLADKFITWLTLLSGLSISAVAVYYSVAGLISIFAAATIPIAVMGVVLEISKLIATVWLKQNWFIAPRLIRGYLFVAVSILMMITSMGIFGYLSKAHLDQNVPTGDIAAQVALLDEKIKTERENIDAARKALAQMDSTVDQTMSRSEDEKGAARATQIRRSQAKERAALQSEIATAQRNITSLNDQRAPIAKELRKVEAEVGPIKYIAALIYGDNPDQNLLERAVRWVIIIIVVVFDPLAVILLLASQYSFQWFRKQQEELNATTDDNIHNELRDSDADSGSSNEPVVAVDSPPEKEKRDNFDLSNHAYLKKPFASFSGLKPMVYIPEKEQEEVQEVQEEVNPTRIEDASLEEIEQTLDEGLLHDKIAKQQWKAGHPDDTIHRQQKLYELGLIEQLPWEKVEELDEKIAESEDSKKKGTT